MAWLKVLHVLFVILWMGSLLTLSHFSKTLAKLEPPFRVKFHDILKRMALFIDLPSMCLAVLFGALLFIDKPLSFFKGGWFHMKMTFVALLIVCDILTLRGLLKAKLLHLGKGIRGGVLHTLAGLFLIGVLISIYVVRNKEQEILEKHRQTPAQIDNLVGKKGEYSYDVQSAKMEVLKGYNVTT